MGTRDPKVFVIMWQMRVDAAISLALDFCVVLVTKVLERDLKAFYAGQALSC